jgi:hypothetical protein
MMPLRLIGSLALLTLAGCATAPTPPPKPNLPALPVTATAACARPMTKIGTDLGVAALKWKATAVCEGGKRASLITFYRTLSIGLKGK